MPEANPLVTRIDGILGSARQHAARSVNSVQVLANWLIGREIVVEQQEGLERAVYGEMVIPELAKRLKARGTKGYGETNLKLCRQFHIEYPLFLQGPIGHALRDQFRLPAHPPPQMGHAPSDESAAGQRIPESGILDAPRREFTPGRFCSDLSWTHYRALLRVKKDEARHFYEIEALRHSWSARELDRQINSLLFERLAKSSDKNGVLRLASEGHRPTQPADIFKDPVIIEFLGQLQLYVNYYDRERRAPDDNPTLGLLLATDKNDAMVKYTLAEGQQSIFASRYQLHLPSEEQLAAEIERELRELT